MSDALAPRMMMGAAVGATIGATCALVRWGMHQKAQQAQDLGVVVRHVRADPQLMEILSRFKPLAQVSPHAEQLYQTLISQCEELYALAGAKGGAQIRANRLCAATIACARTLSKQALRSTDLSVAPLFTDVEELEGILNNFLHNMLLDS